MTIPQRQRRPRRPKVLSLLARLYPDQAARRAELMATAWRWHKALYAIEAPADGPPSWHSPDRPTMEDLDAFEALARTVNRPRVVWNARQANDCIRSILEVLAGEPMPASRRTPRALHAYAATSATYLDRVVRVCASSSHRRSLLATRER